MKTALITGISGQDGSLLADLLLSKGYKVCAISHHELNASDSKARNYKHFLPQIQWVHADFKETTKIADFLKMNTPDEVYHLGAQSFPSAGFSGNYPAFDANAAGVYNLLSLVYEANPSARFFFAGSSEIFGDNAQVTMNEASAFYPKTMYGISKLVGHELIRNYRENLNKFTVTGFLFNHESPRRGEEFVTRKITLGAAKIKLGLEKKLILGSLDSKRDWSAAEDFVEGFHLALNHSKAQDYVFSSGKLHTVRDFVEVVFGSLGLKYEDHIELNPAFNRPSKFDLVGDFTRAKTELGWKHKVSFEQMIDRMVKADLDYLKSV